MKKPLILAVFATSILLTSCGGGADSADSGEKCESNGGKEVSCKDLENSKKLDDMSMDLVTNLMGTTYAEAIETNEAIFEKMKPLMSSMENVIKADPAEKEEYYVETIESAIANVATWKQILSDIETIEITASWEQDPVYPKEMDLAVRFTNNTSSNIDKLGGVMTYYDTDDVVIIEGPIEFYTFTFEPEVKSMTPGYEGFSDHGLNMTKEQRATISTVTIKLDEISYTEESGY